jgi:D-3-phosphoglycerate dehydrogenase / 2-oxoglutarate reductase
MIDLKKCRVLVTPTSFAKNDPSLVSFLQSQVGEVIINVKGRPLTSAELIPLLENMDGFIAGMDEIDKRVILSAKQLKVIARYGVGLNNVDLDAAKKQGITVTYTPGVNASSVADLTIALILLLCRPICRASEQARAGLWPRTSGLCLEGKTVGIIGLGSIGRQVARRLSGFDCRVLAYDIVENVKLNELVNVEIVELDSLITESNFISLHVPLTPQTKNMVDADFLKKMKKGSFLINTARGELIDEQALINALTEGKPAGVALDAFRKEPIEKDNPLLKFPQVIATPHMGAHTDSAINAMGWGSTLDCLAVLKGEQPKYPAT